MALYDAITYDPYIIAYYSCIAKNISISRQLSSLVCYLYLTCKKIYDKHFNVILESRTIEA